MFYKTKVKEKVRVPPKKLGVKIKESILEVCKEDYEGRIENNIGVIIAVTGIDKIGDGHVIPGDGSAYYETEIEMLTYKPTMHEIVRGTITEATEFGAFVRIGPIEGLIHVSQIMDDFINYDAKLPGFVGKKTDKKIVQEDDVLAKIVTISMKDDTSNSKIGLTMRQIGLGKNDWIAIAAKQDKKNEKKEVQEKPVQKKSEKKEKKK
ncbi:MAG: DNA-directed RNA polymerase [Candidatus ainarchaeum sp.]|nr:DNA-directed RNA polymerase [Candidatus ainarchaeum sp.]